MEIAFGSVPSRRLGRSLGINNIPPKVCSYACTYCQVGATTDRSPKPRVFYPPEEVAERVTERVTAITASGETIDYLTFVPDGEPTLDANLGEAIALLRPLGIPIAVISNASLVWRAQVAAALQTADWVSLKVDTVDEAAWRRLNRPHPALCLPEVLEGIRHFAARFRGTLAAETMLVAGVNDDPDRLEATADFLMEAQVAEAHLSLPLRPTALPGVKAPAAAAVAEARRIFEERLRRVFCLFTPEEGAFASCGDVGQDLVGICAVHPMRQEAVCDLLQRRGATWQVVEDLLAGGLLEARHHEGGTFYGCPPRVRPALS